MVPWVGLPVRPEPEPCMTIRAGSNVLRQWCAARALVLSFRLFWPSVLSELLNGMTVTR
jgi:hypothetical protein